MISKEVQPYPFTDDMIVYLKTPKVTNIMIINISDSIKKQDIE